MVESLMLTARGQWTIAHVDHGLWVNLLPGGTVWDGVGTVGAAYWCQNCGPGRHGQQPWRRQYERLRGWLQRADICAGRRRS
eukprot:4782420-Prymnesium_polylepis.1